MINFKKWFSRQVDEGLTEALQLIAFGVSCWFLGSMAIKFAYFLINSIGGQ